MNFGDDYIDVSVDDDENGSDNLDEGRRNHQWSLSCCLCPGHGDGGTSVQVLIMMTHFWHYTVSLLELCHFWNFCHFSMYLHFGNLRVMAGTICQYYYTFGYLTMAGLAFLLNDSWQVVIVIYH